MSSTEREPRTSPAGQEAKAEIKLKKVKNLSAHLTNGEWLTSMPGTDEQKRFLLNCTGCHTLERIMKSTYDADGFLEVIQRMSLYYPGSTPLKPQRLAGSATRDVERGGNGRTTAEWLASVNLSQEPAWAFSAQDPAAAHGQVHACDHYRIRFAESR